MTPGGTTAGAGEARRSLIRNLALLTLVTGGTILTVTLRGAYAAVEDLVFDRIDRTADQAEAHLHSFFDPVRTNLLIARDWGRDGGLADGSPDALNPRFMPVLEEIEQVSSMLIGDDTGREYMLLRLDEEWRNRLTNVDARGKQVRMRSTPRPRGDPRGWAEEVDYDPRERLWFKGAVAAPAEAVHWTRPYQFFTTKDPGITASVRWRAGPDAPLSVVAFDVMLRDVTRFTRGLDVSENGEAVVLSSTGCVIGFPNDDRFETEDARKKLALCQAVELEIPALAEGVREWKSRGSQKREVFPFESDGEAWYAGFQPFDLGNERLWIVVLVPESDLLGDVDSERNLILLITAIALLVGIGMAVTVDRQYRRRMASEVAKARRLGQYTLVAKIGAGGMGQVFRASHAMLRRPTAVKLLQPDRAGSESALKTFEREVQATSRLNHPNTIAIYDYGRTPGGVFYYAMEYIEGVTLEDLVDAFGALPPARVIHLLRQACGSLSEAHGVGLVHRDVKPHNLMLCERGGVCDVIKVLDFGLVKETGETSVSLSQSGSISGTPLYMAPESIKTPKDVDGRADIYALGAVGYYLLTGTTVFTGASGMEVLTKHVGEQAERPSARTGKPLPTDLEDVLLKCLAKKPEERFQSADAFDAALAACADAGRWSREEAHAWWDAHRAAVADLRPATGDVSAPPATGFTVNLETRT